MIPHYLLVLVGQQLKRDMDLVGNANGGNGFTQTGDDGRLNFQSGKTFSQIFKGIHDLGTKVQRHRCLFTW